MGCKCSCLFGSKVKKNQNQVNIEPTTVASLQTEYKDQEAYGEPVQQATCEMIEELDTQRQHEDKALMGKLSGNGPPAKTSSVPVFDSIADEIKGGGRLISGKANRMEELSV